MEQRMQTVRGKIIFLSLVFSTLSWSMQLNAQEQTIIKCAVNYDLLNSFFEDQGDVLLAKRTIDFNKRKIDDLLVLDNWKEAKNNIANVKHQDIQLEQILDDNILSKLFLQISNSSSAALDRSKLAESITLFAQNPKNKFSWYVSETINFRGLDNYTYMLLYVEKVSLDKTSGSGSFYLYKNSTSHGWKEVFEFPYWIA